MMTKGFLAAFAAALVLLALESNAAVSATTKIMQMDIYDGTTCSGSKSSMPFLVAGTCNMLGLDLSYKPNCETDSYDFYETSNCTGAATSSAFTCVAAFPPSLPNAFGFSCGEYPTNNLVTVTVSTAGCAGTELDLTVPISYSFTLVLNECLRVPSFGSSPSLSYRTTASGRTLTMSMFQGSTCSGTPAEAFSADLDGGCKNNQGALLAGRRLQGTSQGVVFKTAVAGATIDGVSGNSASMAALDAFVAGAFLLVASFVAMQ